MALLLRKVLDAYNYVFYDICDERTKDMFPSGFFLMILMPFYVYFANSLGPNLMRDVKPFKLRTPIFYYNLFQIVICLYMLYLGTYGGWLNGNNYTCQEYDATENPRSRSMINAVWWYTVVKIIDLMDTVFFVLRKKDRQISFLHVFHHFMMPLASFIALKYYPTGHGTLVGYINCIVHVIMYTYYLISGLGPKYQKYLWWKKHVTTMQLVQFSLLFVHNIRALFDSSCNYPKWIHFLLCLHSIQFIYLFGTFYYVNYIKGSKKSAEKTTKTYPPGTRFTNFRSEKSKAQ